MELVILLAIMIFIIIYRQYQGQNVYKFITAQAGTLYDKFAPYSFKVVREKTKNTITFIICSSIFYQISC